MKVEETLTGADGSPSSIPVGINGTDLGIIYEMPNKEMGFLFGDTFGTVGWISNSMAIVDLNQEHDWTRNFFITDWVKGSNGLAKELLSSLKQDNVEMTVIPNGALSFPSEGTIYMQYMSIKHWGNPGEWVINNASYAISKDNGQNWAKQDQTFVFPADSRFAQVSMTLNPSDPSDHYIYLLGTAAGRIGPIYLARIASSNGSGANLLNASLYEYLANSPDQPDFPSWTNKESAAAVLVQTQSGETSIAWNSLFGQWMVMYFDNARYDIMIRVGAHIWGPYSDAVEVASGVRYPELYGGYMHSKFVTQGSKPNETQIYFTMSMYNKYEVFWCSAVLAP